MNHSAFQHLTPGLRYEVTEPFDDFDGITHAVGETWTFVGHAFLPYDDGLSLFVTLDDGAERHVRLQWRSDAQGPIIDDLERYIGPAG